MITFNKIEAHRVDKLPHLYNKDVAEALLSVGHNLSESLHIPVFVHFRDIWVPSIMEWGQLIQVGVELYKVVGSKCRSVKFVVSPTATNITIQAVKFDAAVFARSLYDIWLEQKRTDELFGIFDVLPFERLPKQFREGIFIENE